VEALDSSGYSFFNIDTLAPVSEAAIKGQSFRDIMHARASADGRTYGLWATSHSPSGGNIMIYGAEPYWFNKHESFGHVIPGYSGEIIFTGQGIFDLKMQPYKPETWSKDFSYIPAFNSGMFLSYKTLSFPHASDPTFPLRLHLSLDSNASFKVTNLKKTDFDPQDTWAKNDFTNDKRFICSPLYNAIAILPYSGSIRLILFDLDEMLKDVEDNYLFVVSPPARSMLPGGKYTYKIDAKSKSGKIKYQLETGPAGMSVSDSGMVVESSERHEKHQRGGCNTDFK
jgi:hypothetical protein